MEIYDLCIIGAGMYGSAAARHASANSGSKVCLIGPNEPKEHEVKEREILSSHYDEGRTVHISYKNYATQLLARRTISRFRELEKLSDIQFYNPVGTMVTAERYSRHYFDLIQGFELHQVQYVDLFRGDTLKQRFPFLKLDKCDYPLFDDDGAGYISARKIVEAQKKVAQSQGCHIIDDIVIDVKDILDGVHVIITKKRNIVRAKRVLFCTGAFTPFNKFELIKGLKIEVIKETAVLIKIPEEEKDRLSSMPTLTMYRDGIADMPPSEIGAYILPPVQYPDGQWYLKIGHLGNQGKADSLEDVKKWYTSDGDEEVKDKYSRFLISIIPNLKVDKIQTKTCITCESPSDLPYIDRITPTITVAVVGNGRGATMSDEVGRIAAELSLTGKWDSELPKRLFEAIMEDD